jgi:RimJ/RimL family protein N-acetyltransferase
LVPAAAAFRRYRGGEDARSVHNTVRRSVVVATFPEYDAQLTRAGTAHVRRVRPEDRDGLTALHARLSEETVHLRYFTAAPNLERELDRLLRPVDDQHEALVALIDGEIVGVAGYERTTLDAAEVAFLIDDDHHGLGVATILLGILATAAKQRGIAHFVADTFIYNLPMLSVFRDCGLCYWASADGEVMQIRVPLDDSIDDPVNVHVPLVVGKVEAT